MRFIAVKRTGKIIDIEGIKTAIPDAKTDTVIGIFDNPGKAFGATLKHEIFDTERGIYSTVYFMPKEDQAGVQLKLF